MSEKIIVDNLRYKDKEATISLAKKLCDIDCIEELNIKKTEIHFKYNDINDKILLYVLKACPITNNKRTYFMTRYVYNEEKVIHLETCSESKLIKFIKGEIEC